MEKVIITVESKWVNEDVVNAFTKKLKNTYNINGKFQDGGKEDSSWILEGFVKDIINALNDNWLMHGLISAEEIMNNHDMTLLNLKPSQESAVDF